MAIYEVFQIILNKEDSVLINSHGWNASPKIKAYIESRTGNFDNSFLEYYTSVAFIEADSVSEVFDIGNIGPESKIQRTSPNMHSVSVGDLIKDATGKIFIVSPIGFTEFNK